MRKSCTSNLIKQITLNKIKHADAGSRFHKKFEGEPFPTLSEVLEKYSNVVGKAQCVIV